jgi:hypothetical protein
MRRLFRGFLKILQAEFILYGVLAALGGIVYIIQAIS